MTKEEKKVFVSGLMASVTVSIFDKIDSGDIPEEWDGIELRWYLAEKLGQQTVSPTNFYTKGRKRDYDNAVLVSGVL